MSAASLAQRLLRPQLRQMRPYAPSATAAIKLDAMENPYPLPPPLRDEWLSALGQVALNRYPDPSASAVLEGLRERWAIDQRWALLPGNGSDELIQLLVQALARPRATMAVFDPSFVMYRQIAAANGMRCVGLPLQEHDFQPDESALADFLARHRPALVLVASPNNPSGNCLRASAIACLLSCSPGVVVIDEAYMPFCDAHCLALLEQHPRLLILRTVSKMGLAGLRIGLLIGDPCWLREFNKIRLPYNINALSQTSLSFLLQHWATFAEQIACIRQQRAMLYAELAQHPRLKVYPSDANFLLLRSRDGIEAALFKRLLAAGILIKYLPRLGKAGDALRVTVGLPTENRCFVDTLVAAIAEETRL